MDGLYGGGVDMSTHGTIHNLSFFSKKIFYINFSVALIYTIGGLFVFGSSVVNGRFYEGMTINETIFWLFIFYVVIVSLLPFSFTLHKIKH